MAEIVLEANLRKITGKKVKELRRQGKIPAVLYGHSVKSKNLAIDERSFRQVFRQAGTSSLVDLKVEEGEKPVKVLIHAASFHPVSDRPLHIDFYQVKMTEKITTEIPLNFVGEAPAVRELEGNLIRSRDHLKVECLPSDLVPAIPVDVSVLKTFDEAIHIKDISLPSGITVLDDPEEVVAVVTPPRSEEELKAMEEEAAAEAEKAAIEGIEAEAAKEKAAKEAEKAAEEGVEEGATPAEKAEKPTV